VPGHSRVGIIKIFRFLSDKRVMFADRQVKISAPLLKTKLGEIRKWLAPPPPEEPQSADSTDWYAGLCVEPHTFSVQLSKLQTALTGPPVAQQAAQDVQPKPVETVEIEFRSEPNA
jgi:hypothetical protein